MQNLNGLEKRIFVHGDSIFWPTVIGDSDADQKFRMPAEVRNRMNMMTGTTYLIMIL